MDGRRETEQAVTAGARGRAAAEDTDVGGQTQDNFGSRTDRPRDGVATGRVQGDGLMDGGEQGGNGTQEGAGGQQGGTFTSALRHPLGWPSAPCSGWRQTVSPNKKGARCPVLRETRDRCTDRCSWSSCSGHQQDPLVRGGVSSLLGCAGNSPRGPEGKPRGGGRDGQASPPEVHLGQHSPSLPFPLGVRRQGATDWVS